MHELAGVEAVPYMERLCQALSSVETTGEGGARLSLEAAVGRAVDRIAGLGPEGKVLLVGNGGSAAIVSHMQNDLCKAVGVRALVFNEAPLLTALTNDNGYAGAFARLVSLWASRGDVLVAVSSAGRSENILRACRAARERGCRVLTLSGFAADNPLRREGELNFHVPSDFYGHVEVAHMALAHLLSDRAMARRAHREGGTRIG
ncbi:MAG: SIS domain-containing protein [Planctomycetes bacterium]|nr:SIS domain-containing protein [Planctomycetota bacterium]